MLGLASAPILAAGLPGLYAWILPTGQRNAVCVLAAESLVLAPCQPVLAAQQVGAG